MKVPAALLVWASLLAGSSAASDTALPQSDNAWFADAQAALQARLGRTPNTRRAKNVILMIADGYGISTNVATRIWQGQRNGMLGEGNVLPHETFPYLALAKTYSVNAQTPDSASTGTAMQSGVKTREGVLGVDETLSRGDCDAVARASVASIAEILAGEGKSVGFVSTARITHATPASGYAHSAERGFEDDSRLPGDCEVPDIASQLLAKLRSGEVDLAMGGGRRHFLPRNVRDEEGRRGKRRDGRNLIAQARAAGVQYAWNAETAAGLRLDGTPVLGLFESSHMHFEYDRADEPSLSEMTEIAIRSLSSNDEGYFLQVEAGRVDHAHHDGNLHRAVTDGAAFAQAVARAAALTSAEDTLLIVTADHGHAVGFNGYCGRGTPITGLCYGIDAGGVRHADEPVIAADGKPFTAVMYLNGPGAVPIPQADGSYFGTRGNVTQEQATDPDYRQQAIVPTRSETHSGEDVAIYARGPWAHLFDGTVEQSYIFHVMRHATTAR
jgi:alkaline phosphatase